MIIKVILFGALIDATGTNKTEVKDVSDMEELKSKLLVAFPELSNYKFVAAVHNQVVKGNIKLNDGDTVALLPPFAGG